MAETRQRTASIAAEQLKSTVGKKGGLAFTDEFEVNI